MEFLNGFGFVNRISCFVDKKKDGRPKSGDGSEEEKQLASGSYQQVASSHFYVFFKVFSETKNTTGLPDTGLVRVITTVS